MNTFRLIYLLTLFTTTCEGTVLRINGSNEYRLRKELLKDIDVMVRPVENPSLAVNVSFFLIVSNLMDLDNKRQVLTTKVWITQKWHNPFLTWKEEDYDGIDRIQVSPTEIWVPDIVLYNNADKQVYQAGHVVLFKSWVVVYSDGTCLWDSPAIVESDCDVDVTSFPFDRQECHLIFASGTYNSKQLDIHPMQPISEDETKADNSTGEWKAENVIERVRRQFIQRKLGVKEEYITLNYTLVVQRKSLYYVMYLIIPCVICTVLVLVSFAIPPENGERIGFCSTIMLSVSVYLLLISELLPDNSGNLPILGIYYNLTMAEIALALVATILVLRAYHSASEPPSCIKALYRMCKARKKRKQDRKADRKKQKRNAVGVENAETQDIAMEISKPVARSDSAEKMCSADNMENNEAEDRKIWRSVAVLWDRVFFWTFLAMFIVSTGFLINGSLRHPASLKF